MSVNEDINFDGCHPADDDIGEEPGFIPLPTITPEELIHLRAQVAESVTLQQALDVALLNSQNLTDERIAAVNREAAVAQSLQEVTLNLLAQTQQNVALVQLNDELNAHARILTTERDDALNQKDAFAARADGMEAQVGPLQETKVALDFALQAIQNITAEKEVLVNEKAETQRLFQETRLSLEAKTQENADLILAKLALDGKIRDAKDIIEQWETALNTERENYRILEDGIDERISKALDTQRDELRTV